MGALVRLSPNFAELTSHKTACAVYLLALEGEARNPLAHPSELAGILGERCSVGRSSIVKRFGALGSEVLMWQAKLPWLIAHQKDSSGRSNVAKRTLVARNLKDVIQWQDDIWTKMVEDLGRPSLQIPEPDEDSMSESSISSADSAGRRMDDLSFENSRPTKRRRTKGVLKDASQFLLNPYGSRIPSSEPQPSTPTSEVPMFMPSYILAASSNPLATGSSASTPTRLQLLSTIRGGAMNIRDEELFDTHEWEEISRDEDEILVMQHLWAQDDDFQAADTRAHVLKERSRKKGGEDGWAPGKSKKSRINLDALAVFMGDEKEDEPDDGGLEYLGLLDMDDKAGSSEGEDMILGDWRPMSP
jgi:transcription factor IIIB 90 kDa subunit